MRIAHIITFLGLAGLAVAQPPTDSRVKATAALERAQVALGGLDRLLAVRTLSKTVELTRQPNGDKAQQSVVIIFPNTIRLASTVGSMAYTAFYSEKTAWIQYPWSVEGEFPKWQAVAARQDLLRQLERLVISDRDSTRNLEFIGREQVEGAEADVVQVSSEEGGKVRLWIAAVSGDPLKLEYPRIVAQGKGPMVSEYYSDFRKVGGIRSPFRIKMLEDGQPYMESVVVSLEYNKSLRAEDLARRNEPPKK